MSWIGESPAAVPVTPAATAITSSGLMRAAKPRMTTRIPSSVSMQAPPGDALAIPSRPAEALVPGMSGCIDNLARSAHDARRFTLPVAREGRPSLGDRPPCARARARVLRDALDLPALAGGR